MRWFKYFAVHWYCLKAHAHKNIIGENDTICICLNIPPILKLWNAILKSCYFDVMMPLGIDYGRRLTLTYLCPRKWLLCPHLSSLPPLKQKFSGSLTGAFHTSFIWRKKGIVHECLVYFFSNWGHWWVPY